MRLLETITDRKSKKLAVLIDPDKNSNSSLEKIINECNEAGIDFIFTGGSLVFGNIHETLAIIKNLTRIPVLIFPGNYLQVSDKADGILFISLISGRNPEYLIGQHVISAPSIKKSGIEVIPTGYILIENGKMTSVEYMSNTIPIPAEKKEIVIATALAGEMLGMKMIYLEAGSGAAKSVSLGLISEVRKNINIPLLVGGGIRSAEEAVNIFNAGADLIVIGSVVEEDPEIIHDLGKSRDI